MKSLREIYNVCTEPPVDYKKINEEFDVDAAIWMKDKSLYISFQHSNSRVDWGLNYSTWKAPYTSMEYEFYVHSGFINAYRSVRETIQEEYKKYIDENFERPHVVIAGYSLGGALAKLCYEDFFWRIENIPSMSHLEIEGYSLGAPSVFSFIKNRKEIKRRLAGFVSIANGNDIVTRVPPTWLLYFREVKDIILGKRMPYFGVMLPSAAYNHHWDSYLGRIKDKNFKDSKHNNPVYKSSILVYCAIYFVIAIAIASLGLYI